MKKTFNEMVKDYQKSLNETEAKRFKSLNFDKQNEEVVNFYIEHIKMSPTDEDIYDEVERYATKEQQSQMYEALKQRIYSEVESHGDNYYQWEYDCVIMVQA